MLGLKLNHVSKSGHWSDDIEFKALKITNETPNAIQ